MTTSTSESSPVLFSVANGIRSITLNRPRSLNAINKTLAEALLKSLDECKDPSIRCVCLTGASDVFCAGQDLLEASASSPEELGRKVGELYNPIIRAIQELEKPVLAAVNGPAAAADAERMGMIYKVFPQAEFLQKRDYLTTRLAKMPTKALALTKQVLITSFTNDLTRQLDTEAENQKLALMSADLMSADFKEGTQAFFEKRKPNFIGA
jgi:enoyl-CoA hydratase/carnithine racemase